VERSAVGDAVRAIAADAAEVFDDGWPGHPQDAVEDARRGISRRSRPRTASTAVDLTP
jgi:hypothetical protein